MAKPKGLGRGLEALLATNHTQDQLQYLPLGVIRPGQYQPRTRMDEAALQSLAESIRAQGVIQPLVVRPLGYDAYELVAGERRWRASQMAGLTEVPVLVRQIADEAALAMALIENIQREDLNVLEEAQGLKRLIDEFGMTHEAVAVAVGRSRSAVSNALRLLGLSEPVQVLVHEGKLGMGHVRPLLPLPVLAQIPLAQEAAEKGWSAREVEARATALLRTPPAAASRRAADTDIVRWSEEISGDIGAKVTIKPGKQGHGRLVLEYASLNQLEAWVEKLRVKN